MIDATGAAEQVLRACAIEFRRLSVIELNRSNQAETAVVLLVFVDRQAQPAALIKAGSGPERARALRAEHDNLERLGARLPPALRATVPAPLYFAAQGATTLLAETALPGPRMKNMAPNAYFGSAAFRDHLRLTAAWLVGFHRAWADPAPQAEPARSTSDLERQIEQYRADFRASDALGRLLDRASKRLAAQTVPRSPWHGDFCSANIVLPSRARIGVIDWEQPLGLSAPLLDLLHFFASIWCVPYRKGEAARAANLRELFFGRHPLRERLRRIGLDYAAAVGIEPADLAPLSALAWAIYANRKRRDLARRPGSARLPGSDPADGDTAHWPLIVLQDDRCVNLELLAEHEPYYLFAP